MSRTYKESSRRVLAKEIEYSENTRLRRVEEEQGGFPDLLCLHALAFTSSYKLAYIGLERRDLSSNIIILNR